MYIVEVKYRVFWQFKDYNHYKVTKCKKIINTKTSTILKQSIKGGQVGYWINKQFIKRKDLNNHLELIPKKEKIPF